MEILVTAPHASCIGPPGEHHMCDSLSDPAARDLISKLERVQYFPGTIYRGVSDLNRIESRGTPYRETVTQRLAQARLLIDIHSYPEGEFSRSDFTILDNFPGTNYSRELFQLLFSRGVNVAYFYGTEINDIVEVARSNGVPAILLEYNESLDPEKISQINQIVAEWSSAIGRG